jgi:hypothetical protein
MPNLDVESSGPIYPTIILAVVELLERDMSRLVMEAREMLELVEL